MIRSFAARETESVWHGERNSQLSWEAPNG